MPKLQHSIDLFDKDGMRVWVMDAPVIVETPNDSIPVMTLTISPTKALVTQLSNRLAGRLAEYIAP